MSAPNPKQIDALIAEYSEAQKTAAAAAAVAKQEQAVTDEIKVRLVAMVESYGVRHTEKSKRLAGVHNTATTTTATRMSLDDALVYKFRVYLDKSETPELAERFFTQQTTYQLVAAPAEVLKTLDVAKKVRTKLQTLLALCWQVKTNAPSLKVDVVIPA